jgi:ComF family protein
MRLSKLFATNTDRLLSTAKAVADSVIPRRCAFCGSRRYDTEGEICAGCYADLPWIENSCRRCAEPVTTVLPENVHCGNCQQRPPPFSAAVAPLLYTFPVDAAIRAMKFRRKLFYVPAFAEIIDNAYARLPGDIDAVLPVPLHWRRHGVRGFNQAAEVSKPIRKKYGLKLIRNVSRTRPTQYQSGLAAKQRRQNLRLAFTARGEVMAKHVLIIDDVITTGETCRQLARTVLRAGAARVCIIAIARATTASRSPASK